MGQRLATRIRILILRALLRQVSTPWLAEFCLDSSGRRREIRQCSLLSQLQASFLVLRFVVHPSTTRPHSLSLTSFSQDISFFDAPENSSGALLSALASDAASVRGAVGDRVGHMLTLLSCVVGSYAIAFKSRCVVWRLCLM